jgi:transcriptional regulator with XRE-family HTH domain
MKRFGEKLRTLRKRSGMTMRELAYELGLRSHGYIGDLEKGRRKPSLELAIKMADLFELSLDQLARDELEVD